jgi:hypothetical protein
MVIVLGVYQNAWSINEIKVHATKLHIEPGANQTLIENIIKIRSGGAGQELANESCQQLIKADPKALVAVVYALENANPLAENLLRGVAETLCDIQQAAPLKESIQGLTKLVEHAELRPQTRSLAYELLCLLDPKNAESMIPNFINDPSDELRRLAVAQLIEDASKLNAQTDQVQLKAIYQQALASATDDDQVQLIKKPLEKMGEKVNLQQHFGFLNTWSMIGPFNNKDMLGFPVAYPPEEVIKLDATLTGQLGEVTWKEYKTDDEYGKMNIAKQLGPHKGAITYAYTTFNYDQDEPVEFRLATPNAWKLWVNNELVFAREEYHRGSFFDQYRIPGKLKSGKNTILLKVCQNEQTQDWAQDWEFQFRICDVTGRAVHEK